jgi:hypothetical protein
MKKASTSKKKSATKAGATTRLPTGERRHSSTAASRSIDAKVKRSSRAETAPDWRAQTLTRVRTIILRAVPVIEEVKWRKPSNAMAGVPVWSSARAHGRGTAIICTGETYKNVVKLTFAKGAALEDPARLFNASLQGGARRAIDIREGEAINERALAALIRAAAALNTEA